MSINKLKNMNKTFTLFLIFGAIILTSCRRNQPVEVYHIFENSSWQRFDIPTFEVPVTEAEESWDVCFFIRLTRSFPYNEMTINMIMNTPSGEERIGEYNLKIKSPGGAFLVKFDGDSSENIILLKRELYCSKAGILRVAIENLTPRLQTEGVIGAGIRLTPSGK